MGHQIKQIRTISQVEIGSDLFFGEMIPVRFPTSATRICTGGFTQMGIPSNYESFDSCR